jgi:putative phosphoesterase
MKVGIISDSHDSKKNVLRAVKVFGRRGVEYVFHAGDIISPATAAVFGGVAGAKFVGVYGNCDCDRDLLAGAIGNFGGEIYEGTYRGQVGGKRVLMSHQLEVPERTAENGQYDLVIYGHTHRLDIRRVGGALVVNPGRSGGGLMKKATVVIVELDGMEAEEVVLR